MLCQSIFRAHKREQYAYTASTNSAKAASQARNRHNQNREKENTTQQFLKENKTNITATSVDFNITQNSIGGYGETRDTPSGTRATHINKHAPIAPLSEQPAHKHTHHQATKKKRGAGPTTKTVAQAPPLILSHAQTRHATRTHPHTQTTTHPASTRPHTRTH